MVKKRRSFRLFLAFFLIFAVIGYGLLAYFHLIPGRTYNAADFGIEVIKSPNDYNGNGVDDATDILLGARQDAVNKPIYRSRYYEGGYPPEEEGVCTDVIWRAFRNAGYELKDMVDQDIAAHVELYPRVVGEPDPNIDFRRVPNLQVFFQRHARSLTIDPYDIGAWQPGDIIVFGNSHIGIISDKRNKDGIPYLIHNSGSPVREEDSLLRIHRKKAISGHYRFSWEPNG